MQRIRIAILILTALLFSGCGTEYISAPCPTIKPLSPLPDLHFHVERGQIDQNATQEIIHWARLAKRKDAYYHGETTRLQAFNKEGE